MVAQAGAQRSRERLFLDDLEGLRPPFEYVPGTIQTPRDPPEEPVVPPRACRFLCCQQPIALDGGKSPMLEFEAIAVN